MQAELFNKPKRHSPRVMMHVIDAGEYIAKFACAKCAHISDWLRITSVSDAKRGEPCPKCNVNLPHDETRAD